jgi:diguanylate cyclase (GGDEF)-like protein
MNYAIAVLITAAAFYITAITPLFDDALIFLPYTAVIISALFLGTGPAILSLVIMIVAFNFLFSEVQPWHAFQLVSAVEFVVLVVVIFFITSAIKSRNKLIEQLEKYSATDSLTGLMNRRRFLERLVFLSKIAQRRNSSFAVLFTDLDGFKKINDSKGHDVGDALLVMVGQRISSMLREEDTVARFGGDEFMVLLGEIASAEDAVAVAEKIRKQISEKMEWKQEEHSLTISVGIAIFPIHGTDPERLVKRADRALYEAKKKGKDRIQVYVND